MVVIWDVIVGVVMWDVYFLGLSSEMLSSAGLSSGVLFRGCLL